MKVWISKSLTLTDHYHTDKDCMHLKRVDEVVQKDDSQLPNKELCKVCSGDMEWSSGKGMNLRQRLESGEIDYQSGFENV